MRGEEKGQIMQRLAKRNEFEIRANGVSWLPVPRMST
jgi:hypothetical protein